MRMRNEAVEVELLQAIMKTRTMRARRGLPARMSMVAAMVAAMTAAVVAVVATPIAAFASSITYDFLSGNATIRGTLAGSSTSIFEGATAIDVPLIGISATYDPDLGTNGRLQSFTIAASDFSIDLNEAMVGLDTIDVTGATLTSLSGSDLNAFGQFALPVSITGTVAGAFPGGGGFGPVPISSIGGSGSASGLVGVTDDLIMISVLGVTVASFPQLASTDPNAPAVEIKADFFFVGRAAPTVPEPTSALLFLAGLGVVQTSLRRRN